MPLFVIPNISANGRYNGRYSSMASLLTLDEAIERLRTEPHYEQLIVLNYFDRDIVQSAERFAASTEFGEILKLLRSHKPPASLLDLGAGRGIASYAFSRADYQVTAIDPDPSQVVGLGAIHELIDRTPVTIEIVKSAGEDIPLPDASFEIVYVRQVLHHAANLPRFCAEVFRVLKPGGVFIATREHVVSKPEDLPIFLNNHLLHPMSGGENARLLEDYVDAIKSAGFRITQVLGSHDSMINYYPGTVNDLKNAASMLLKPFLPARVFRPFLTIPFVLNVCQKVLSRRNQTPGRMYSFVAAKP